MSWLAVTLELDQAHAEAFTDALLAAGALGATLEDADAGGAAEQPRFAEPQEGAPSPWRRNRVHVLLDAGADCAALVAAAASACGLASPPPFVCSRVDQLDWVRATQSQFAPLPVGERFWIVPSWHEPPDPQAIVVRLDPGLAFGTGAHATTRLVLVWLERTVPGPAGLLADRPPRAEGAGEPAAVRPRVLDYGCGSGILAIAAAKLGAGEVDAVDLDRRALQVAAQNALRNGVAVRTAAPETLPVGDYDVVVANILANPLVLLEPVFAARTRAGGRIALCGIFASQAAEVIAAYAPDFDLGVGAEAEGWVLLAGRRRAHSAGTKAR